MKLNLLSIALMFFIFSVESAEHLMDNSGMNGSMAGMVHDHQSVPVPDKAAIPKLEVQLFRDIKSGFNLHLKIMNFNIEPPEFESVEDNLLSGHAHLYINGEKIQRIYGRYVHLPEKLFRPGVNMIMVSLNAHNHDVWTKDNKQILASVAIQKDAEQFELTRFASFPLAAH